MKRLTFAIVALAAFGVHAAGTGGVEGTITDQGTGQVVAARLAVSITCGAVHRSTATDGAGHFAFSSLPEGQCTITTGAGAYVATSVAVTVPANAIATIMFGVMSKAAWDKQQAQLAQYQKEAKKYARKPMARQFDMEADAGGFEAPMAMGAGAAMPAPAAAPPPPMHHAPAPMPKMGAKPQPTAPATHAAPPPPPPKGKVAVAQQIAPAQPAGTPPIGGKVVRLDRIAGNDRALKRDADAKHLANAGRPMQAWGGEVNGWAAVRVFPVPQYTKAYDGPRDDFREGNGEHLDRSHGRLSVPPTLCFRMASSGTSSPRVRWRARICLVCVVREAQAVENRSRQADAEDANLVRIRMKKGPVRCVARARDPARNERVAFAYRRLISPRGGGMRLQPTCESDDPRGIDRAVTAQLQHVDAATTVLRAT